MGKILIDDQSTSCFADLVARKRLAINDYFYFAGAILNSLTNSCGGTGRLKRYPCDS
jgi:hypothetical protein